MKTLPLYIKRRGFEYNQVMRNGDIAIYSQHRNNEVVAYETIIVKAAPEHERHGTKFEAAELYPGENAFGSTGWSYGNFGDVSISYNRALHKLQQLIK